MRWATGMIAALGLLLATPGSLVGQQAAVVEPRDVADFVGLSQAAFANCLSAYQAGIERRNLGFGGTNCVFHARGQIEPAYADIRSRPTTSKAESAALADFYTLWQASMDGLEPSPGEIRMAYSSRQAAALQGLRLAGARLKYSPP